MTDELTIVETPDPLILTIEEDKVEVLVLEQPDVQILEILTEGPQGPPDSRPRPSDIAFSVMGEVGPSEIVVMIEITNPIRLIKEKCRASCRRLPTEQTTFDLIHLGDVIGSLTFSTGPDKSGIFSFIDENIVLQPGLFEVLSNQEPTDIADVSITISGER